MQIQVSAQPRFPEPPPTISLWFREPFYTQSVKKKSNTHKNHSVIQDHTTDVLFDFRTKNGSACVYLKAHFLFLLDNNSNSKTDKIIITDDTNTNNPLLQRVHGALSKG